MFKFFERNAKTILRGTGYFTGLSAVTYATVLSEMERQKALEKANPDCDVVSQWMSFGDVCGYNEFSLRPKRDAEQKERVQPSRRP